MSKQKSMPGSFPDSPSRLSSAFPPASCDTVPPSSLPALPPSPIAADETREKNRAKRTKDKERKLRKKQEQQEEMQQQQKKNKKKKKPVVTEAAVTPATVPMLNPDAHDFQPFATLENHPLISITNSPQTISVDSVVREAMAVSVCWLQGCSKRTSPDDGKTVACPACSVNSPVRYCSKEHLYEDIREHFLNHCSRYTVPNLDETVTAPLKARQRRPYLRASKPNDFGNIEHHRQAVYFAMENEEKGDYFIFADIEVLGSISRPSHAQLESCRGTGKLVAQIKIPDTNDPNDLRIPRFRNLVCRCLINGAITDEGAKNCVQMATMVRQQLLNEEKWDDNMITYVAMCMKQEFRFQLPLAMQK